MQYIRSPGCILPFHQLHGDKVAPVAAVEQDDTVRWSGLELEEQVHGSVGLQRSQAQVATLGFESHWVGNDGAHAEACVQLTVVDVAVLAQVDVEQAVEPEALQVADEAGRDVRDKTPLSHHTCLDIVELQASMVTHHLTCNPSKVGTRGEERKKGSYTLPSLICLMLHTLWLCSNTVFHPYWRRFGIFPIIITILILKVVFCWKPKWYRQHD